MNLAEVLTILAGFVFVSWILWLLKELRKSISGLEKEVRKISVTQGRRSIAALKLENELHALAESMFVLTDGDPAKRAEIERIFQSKRYLWLRAKLERGTVAGDHLMGIEVPSGDEDPWFETDDWIDFIVPEYEDTGGAR